MPTAADTIDRGEAAAETVAAATGTGSLDWQRAAGSLGPRMLAAIGAVLFFTALYRHREFMPDDTMISLRYARNLIEHGALDWNVGERVEGYTNFLHVMASAAVMSLGIEPFTAVRIVNAIALCALLEAVWQCTRSGLAADGAGTAQLRALAPMLVASISAMVMWVQGGLETVMVAALVTGTAACLLPAVVDGRLGDLRSLSAGLLVGAAVLTRPDAVVAAAGLAGGLMIIAPMPVAARLRIAVLAAVGAALLVLPHLAWRWNYYGDLLPNTFYAKIGVPADIRLENSLYHLRLALVQVPPFFLGLVLAFELLVRRRAGRLVTWLTCTIVLHTLYIAWAGGDHLGGSRHVLPIAGLASVLCAATLADFAGRERSVRFIVVVAGAVGLHLLLPATQFDQTPFAGQIIGRHLQATERPGTLVALNTAGSTPYYAPDLRFIDMLGLNDHHIARRSPLPIRLPLQRIAGHARGDGAYVLDRKPAIVILGPSDGTTVDLPLFLSDIELAESAQFHRCYRLETIELAVPPEARRDGQPTFTYRRYRRTCAE